MQTERYTPDNIRLRAYTLATLCSRHVPGAAQQWLPHTRYVHRLYALQLLEVLS